MISFTQPGRWRDRTTEDRDPQTALAARRSLRPKRQGPATLVEFHEPSLEFQAVLKRALTMATIPYPCSCGSLVQAGVGDIALGGTLCWFVSFRCPECGAATEGDGTGFAPDDIRNAVIAETGLWTLDLDNAADRMRAVKELRQALGWSLKEAAQQLKATGALYRGTRAEAESLRHTLGLRGVSARVSQHRDAGSNIDSLSAT